MEDYPDYRYNDEEAMAYAYKAEHGHFPVYKMTCKHCPRNLTAPKSRESGVCASCRDNRPFPSMTSQEAQRLDAVLFNKIEMYGTK